MLEYFNASPVLEYLLAIFISLYGINTVLSFVFSVPKVLKTDDQLVPYCAQNYFFWLLTSIIFFLYGVFLLTNVYLVCIMIGELVLLLLSFAWFMAVKRHFVIGKRKSIKEVRERKAFKIHDH
jgi:hypothetical protein